MALSRPLVGRWQIVAAGLWEADYLDLVEPAALIVRTDVQGEIAFRTMQASLNIDYGPDEIVLSRDAVDGDG